MGKLIYSAITSLEGYVADAEGNFDWAAPDEDVHAFVNDLERSIGTYLYGRRMYEVMVAWETIAPATQSSVMVDYRGDLARGQQGRVLDDPRDGLERTNTDRASLRPRSDPTDERRAERDMGIGGPGLAARAIEEGLVDECHAFVTPMVVGGGTRWLPDIRWELELLDEHRFGSGVVHLHYRTTP